MIMDMVIAEWSNDPPIPIMLGLILISSMYQLLISKSRYFAPKASPLPLQKQICFHLGTLIALIALISPLHILADNYLFSAHMVQHMLLMFAAAPLWVIGTPPWFIKVLLPFTWMQVAFYKVTKPLIAFAIFNGVMWLWHIPRFYNAALESPIIHGLEHVLFLVTAIIGWWPVLGSFGTGRISPPGKIADLFLGLLSCTALAGLITLSPAVLYSGYGENATLLGITSLLDQQIGGVIMWVSGDMVYVLLISTLFLRWLDTGLPDKRDGLMTQGLAHE